MKKIKDLPANERPGKNFLKKEPKYFCPLFLGKVHRKLKKHTTNRSPVIFPLRSKMQVNSDVKDICY